VTVVLLKMENRTGDESLSAMPVWRQPIRRRIASRKFPIGGEVPPRIRDGNGKKPS
jgi:hypothetical protein